MTTTEYALNFALVGLMALQIRGIKVTKAALLFPVVMTLWVAASLLKSIPTGGNDLMLEVGGAVAGASLGALAALATAVTVHARLRHQLRARIRLRTVQTRLTRLRRTTSPGAHPRRLTRTSRGGSTRGSRGEVEHLTYILAGIYDKLDEIARSERRTTIVELDPPRLEPRP